MKGSDQLIGTKKNSLTIVSFFKGKIYASGRFKWMVNVKCDCGSELSTYYESFYQGRRVSCGCHRKKHDNSAKGSAYREYKFSAKRRNYSFDLSIDEFHALTQQDCHYCGIAPSKTTITEGTHFSDEYIHNGIDRVDNKIGYTSDNTVPCCFICNRAKSTGTYDDFMSWINRLINNNKEVIE